MKQIQKQQNVIVEVAVSEIAHIQEQARVHGKSERPGWPLIVLRTPKGWTGPKMVDGLPTEGTWRSHQVPLSGIRDYPEHLRQLKEWLLSYRPGELFNEEGRFRSDLAALAPTRIRRPGDQRMDVAPREVTSLLCIHRHSAPQFS